MIKGCELNVYVWIIWIYVFFLKGYVKEVCFYCLVMMDVGVMFESSIFVKLMKGLRKFYNREIVVEIIEKVRKMVVDR